MRQSRQKRRVPVTRAVRFPRASRWVRALSVVLVAVAAFFGWRHARHRDAPTHPEVDLTTLDPPDADQARHGAGQPRPELLELAHLSPSAGTEWGQERGSARDRAGRLGL